MNEDNTMTFERHEMLLDAIHEAAEEAIVGGHVPASVATQIRATTLRLGQLLCEQDAAPNTNGRDELIEEPDLEDWEQNVSVQAAVLAAMLCNDVEER